MCVRASVCVIDAQIVRYCSPRLHPCVCVLFLFTAGFGICEAANVVFGDFVEFLGLVYCMRVRIPEEIRARPVGGLFLWLHFECLFLDSGYSKEEFEG